MSETISGASQREGRKRPAPNCSRIARAARGSGVEKLRWAETTTGITHVCGGHLGAQIALCGAACYTPAPLDGKQTECEECRRRLSTPGVKHDVADIAPLGWFDGADLDTEQAA